MSTDANEPSPSVDLPPAWKNLEESLGSIESGPLGSSDDKFLSCREEAMEVDTLYVKVPAQAVRHHSSSSAPKGLGAFANFIKAVTRKKTKYPRRTSS